MNPSKSSYARSIRYWYNQVSAGRTVHDSTATIVKLTLIWLLSNTWFRLNVISANVTVLERSRPHWTTSFRTIWFKKWSFWTDWGSDWSSQPLRSSNFIGVLPVGDHYTNFNALTLYWRLYCEMAGYVLQPLRKLKVPISVIQPLYRPYSMVYKTATMGHGSTPSL